MKNYILSAMLVLSGLNARAQVSIEGSNAYGRLKDIRYDVSVPNRLYAATNFGNHILVSDDQGANWHIHYTMPDVKAEITGFRILDATTASFMVNRALDVTRNGVYLLSLETGTVIRHYEIPNPTDDPHIMSYDISGPDGQYVILHDSYKLEGYTGAPQTKVFYTSDYGEGWGLIYFSENFDTVHLNNVAMVPGNPQKLFLARSFSPGDVDGGLMVSEDAGATWTEKLPGKLLHPIAFNPQNPNDMLIGTGIAAGEHPENLYRSSDGGATWAIIPVDWHTIEGFNNIYQIGFDPEDPDNIVVLEEDVVAVSVNNGQSWVTTVYENSDANSYYAGLSVTFDPFEAGRVVIATNYYPQVSDDYGITLSQLQVPFYNTVTAAAAKGQGANRLYYGAQGGLVTKHLSSNTFTAVDTENVFTFNPNKNYLFTEPELPNRLYRFVVRDDFSTSLYLSQDFGESFTELPSVFASDVQVVTSDPQNPSIIYMAFRNGEASDLHRFDITDINNITDTILVSPGPDPEGFGNGVITGIEVSPTDSGILYVAQRDRFYVSENYGEIWTERINGLDPNELIIIYDMARNPFNENEFMITTYTGIYKTTNAGLNWEQVLTTNYITEVQYSDTNAFVAVASNKRLGGLAYTLNGGTTWTAVSQEELKYLNYNDVECIFEGNTITAYFATYDLGIVSYTLEDLPLSVDGPQTGSNAIIVYPNPAHDRIEVSLSGADMLSNVAVYTLTGQKVLQQINPVVNISHLQAGLYIVKAETTGGAVYTQKIIKQ